MNDERIADATQRVYEGESVSSIARSYGVCRATVAFALHPERRDAANEASKRYHDKNPGLAAENSRQWREEHPEHRIAGRIRENKYNETHRKQRSEYAAEYRKVHPDRVKAALRSHYEENHSAYIAANRLRKAMILGATIGNLKEIEEIYRQAREDAPIRCYLCGKLIPLGEGERHVDHVIPLKPDDPTVTPGKHCPSNLRITHATCNWKKNNFMVDTLDWVILGT